MFNKHAFSVYWLITSLLSSFASAAELGLSGGVFGFPATDYYYPNFYDEAGFRGEITFQKVRWWGFFGRLQGYAYPMDDNIFENIIEVGPTPEYEKGRAQLYVRPILGNGLVRFHYPAHYYPYVDHTYLNLGRVG